MSAPPHPSTRSEGVQYDTGQEQDEQRAITNSSRKNEETGPKWKRRSVVDVSGGDRKSRAEGVIFRARCPGCEPSTPDPEQAADVSPHESDLWLRIQGLGL